MPRISGASLAIIGPSGVETVRRPNAPNDLDDEEQRVWRDTVNSMAADWFPGETHGLLTQYCRLVISARRISELKKSLEKPRKGQKFDLLTYRRLAKDEAQISQTMAVLARNMRLSQASTSRHEYVKKRPMTLKKPWDRVDEDADDEEE
jgi:hypothetical protein